MLASTAYLLDYPLALLTILWVLPTTLLLLPAAHVLFELFCILLGLDSLKIHSITADIEAVQQESSGGRRGASIVSEERSTKERQAQLHRAHEFNQLDGARYREFDSVWSALEGGEVRLLSLRWLAKLEDGGGILSRRQELPEEAFISVGRLKKIEADAKAAVDFSKCFQSFLAALQGTGFVSGVLALIKDAFVPRRNVDNLLPIIAVSYCWLEGAHPDREGKQLKLMMQRLNGLCKGRGLIRAAADYGFSDMGVFIDWGSLHQKDPRLWKEWMVCTDDELRAKHDGQTYECMMEERRAYNQSRSATENEAFKRALTNTMDLWYGHTGTTVVLLTELPATLPSSFDTSRTYESRGWTTFERCSTELAKSYRTNAAKWKLVIDIRDQGKEPQRRLPTTPEQMSELLEDRRFMNGADKDVVLQLYSKTACALLGTVDKLSFMGLPLKIGDRWRSPERVGPLLNYCTRLKTLSLAGTQLDNIGMLRLVENLDSGALPELKTLHIGSNRFGADGIIELCEAFNRGVAPQLATCDFSDCLFGDEGVEAFADALQFGRLPAELQSAIFVQNLVTNKGAIALANALLRSPLEKCRLICSNNTIGISGQSALLRATEARHGTSMGLLFALLLGNSPFWPPFMVRVWARGMRGWVECGGWSGIYQRDGVAA